MNILPNEITIAGKTETKEKFGFAATHDENKTFTCEVLFTNQLRADANGNIWDKSIEQRFNETAQVDGLTVWKSNGEIPFADMLLDFVQIGAITFEQAEFSLIQKAKDEIKDVREKISNGLVTFADAAREFSDEKETKFEGGQLTNPTTQDFNFELTRMEPELYSQVQGLKDDEISPVIQDEDRINRIKFKIMTVTDRIDDHKADFARDYLKIKDLALQDKQVKAIEVWQRETIRNTYIKINGEYRGCDFQSNWLKE